MAKTQPLHDHCRSHIHVWRGAPSQLKLALCPASGLGCAFGEHDFASRYSFPQSAQSTEPVNLNHTFSLFFILPVLYFAQTIGFGGHWSNSSVQGYIVTGNDQSVDQRHHLKLNIVKKNDLFREATLGQ